MLLFISVGVPAGHHDNIDNNADVEHLRRRPRARVEPSRGTGSKCALRLLLLLQDLSSRGDPIVDRCEPDRTVPPLRDRFGSRGRVVSHRRSVSPSGARETRLRAHEVTMVCRSACGACCIAPSISPCASLPDGKPAGARCLHLTIELRCALFGRPERPAVCRSLQPQPEMCGVSAGEAMATLIAWESLTRPVHSSVVRR
jgi:hypothetical protein